MSAEQSPRLLDQVRHTMRAKHYSIRTEQAYVNWIKRFILFHHKRVVSLPTADKWYESEMRGIMYPISV